MLINTSITVAMRCPNCGKMDFYYLSRFAISPDHNHKVVCDCGTNLLVLGTKNRKVYWVQIECIMCESNHIMYYRKETLWNSEIMIISCPETGVEIGFIGYKEKVKDCVKRHDKSIRELAEDIGYNDFFQSPIVMAQILERINYLSKKGRLGCTCGSIHLDVDVLEDRIELSCTNCEAYANLQAIDEKSVSLINRLDEIILVENTYFQLDNINKKWLNER